MALAVSTSEYTVAPDSAPLALPQKDRLDELVELMVDTVCSNQEMIRVAGEDYHAEVVQSQGLELHASHIEYVLDWMWETITYIRNIKKSLPAKLYSGLCLRDLLLPPQRADAGVHGPRLRGQG